MKRELFNALERDDFDTVKSLFAQDFRVLLDVTFQGDTPLHIAARQGHQDIAGWILKEKPSFAGARNNDNCRPLHEAAKCGNADLVKILLQQKKSCAFHYNKFGETPLVIACKYGHKETVELLLQANSNKNAIGWYRSIREAAYREYTGATSHLHAAVNGRNPEIVKAILDDSAWHSDLMTKKDKYGRCAVHVAAMKGLSDIIAEFMFRMPDCLEIRAWDQKSVLHIAVEYNQTEIVRIILANKGEERVKELVIRDHDVFHNTALHLAAKNGVDLQLLELLLPFPGVDVNALNDEGMSAVDIASATAQHDTNCAIIVGKLVHAGAIQSSVIPKPTTTCAPCYGSIRRKERDSVDLHMVVASLIATVTFAAIFQVPGGIEDNRGSIHGGRLVTPTTIARLVPFRGVPSVRGEFASLNRVDYSSIHERHNYHHNTS
ncbi:hypothetical protein SUGI_0555530 [Cryptomeria japonica]|nr:hypothetical protein SUGI_0555530 [Cryptomeria japonica]